MYMVNYDYNHLKIVKMFINNWSAGCQVINDREKYLDQMNWYRDAYLQDRQEFVTYVLLNEFDA